MITNLNAIHVLSKVLLVLLTLMVLPQFSHAQDFIEGQLVIKVRNAEDIQAIEDRFQNEGNSVVERIPELNVLVIEVPPGRFESDLEELQNDPDIEYVQKNFITHANVIPNDQFFNLQTYMGVINAPTAWDTELGDPNVIIAVLDTGVSATHQDLSGKVLAGCSTLGAFNENSCGTNTGDVDGHGSGVSGTAAAITNNIVGVAGVCRECSILPIKVLGDNGSGTTVDGAQGILFARNYALSNPNMKVVANMSFGYDCQPFGGISQVEQDAINMAYNAGVLLIAAAGNEANSNLHCPAAGSNVIAVSATTFNDNLANFSSFGSFIDLAAPGGNCTLLSGVCIVVLESIVNILGGTTSTYVGWLGTSFSSPIVAGVAGLVWSQNMTLTNAEVDQILRDTAVDIGIAGNDTFFGDGRIDANAAVIAAGTPPTPPPPVNPVLEGLNPNVAGESNTITVTDAEPGSTVFFRYSLNTGTTVISSAGQCNGQTLDLDNALPITSIVADGSGTAVLNIVVPANFAGITVHLQAYAETGSTCGITNHVTQTIQSTPPPVINPVLAGLNPNIAGQSNSLTVTNVPPGSTVFFHYSTSTGTTIISGGDCNGQSLGLNSAILISSVVADGTGTAVLNINVPGGAAGLGVHLQAYVEGGPGCGISNLVSQTIN